MGVDFEDEFGWEGGDAEVWWIRGSLGAGGGRGLLVCDGHGGTGFDEWRNIQTILQNNSQEDPRLNDV